MFDFFKETIEFLNQYIGQLQNDPYSDAFGMQFFQTMHAVLNFIRTLDIRPLGFGFILPATFISLFFEWKSRHKKGGVL